MDVRLVPKNIASPLSIMAISRMFDKLAVSPCMAQAMESCAEQIDPARQKIYSKKGIGLSSGYLMLCAEVGTVFLKLISNLPLASS